jgi:peptidoglycan/xylan/chitin deacetylase (PgdA/CDA1 family)
MAEQVPVLITWDIDPSYRPRKKRALQAAIELCRELEIRATFFFVAQEARWYPEEIAEMRRAGHEIGSHGLTHGDEEEYDRMQREMQCRYIKEATRLLEERAATPVTAFRGPRVKISPLTLELLSERGYLADSSVCSQRLDMVSSNLINLGWLRAPRSPYHPHRESAFRRGDLEILEVPVSALVIPFISSALYALGLPLMKVLSRLLYAEARSKGKPIVYLGHPSELGPQSLPRFKRSHLSFKTLRTHGLRLRRRLRPNAESRLGLNRALFSYIAALPGTRFMTMREYVRQSRQSTVIGDQRDPALCRGS